MNSANYTDELDFRLTFGEDGTQQPLGHEDIGFNDDCYFLNVSLPQSVVTQPVANLQQNPLTFIPATELQSPGAYKASCTVTRGTVHNTLESPSRLFDCPSIQITSIPTSCNHEVGACQNRVQMHSSEGEGSAGLSRGHLYLPLEPAYRDQSSLCPSPCSSLSSRSWWSDASSCESFSHVYDDVEAELNEAAAHFKLSSPLVSPLSSPLPSPLASPLASPQVSPLVSPFGSPGAQHPGPGEDPWLRYHLQQPSQALFAHSLSPHQSPYQSPRTSVSEETWLSPRPASSSSRPSSRPTSRPTSPCGKRRHSCADGSAGLSSPHLSPIPTPTHSPRGSVTEETWAGNAMLFYPQPLQAEVNVPHKTRKTYQSLEQCKSGAPLGSSVEEQGLKTLSSLLDYPTASSLPGQKREDIVEHFLSVPSHFTWSKPKPTQTPIHTISSLPPLECPLPSQIGPYELSIEVQPRDHHRAHYETEGSRGAIKAACGGHPEVKLIGYNEKPINLQIFIGTADEHTVRPHAFYQAHRITGKTVSTASQETVLSNTKVLEIPLLPENNMSASIDCAGILKLRNSDIELRKGETDIGRKNTRVRVVFRVHVPLVDGTMLSLQAASIAVECSQRAVVELPHIEKFSPVSGSMNGGEEMYIKGPNIFPDSKVIFLQKGPDGRTLWEAEARTIREKSAEMNIVVQIPPYHNKNMTSSVQVQFYVTNGKRKKSTTQHLTYVPAGVKQESGHQGNINPISHTELHGGTHVSYAQYAYSTDHCQYTGGPAALSSLDSPSSHHHRAGLDVEPDSQHILHSLVSMDPVFLGTHHNIRTQFCLNKISKVSPQPACKPNAHQPAHLSGFSPSIVEHRSFSSYPSGTNDTSLSNASFQLQASGYQCPSPVSPRAAVSSLAHLRDAALYPQATLSQHPHAIHQSPSHPRGAHGDYHQIIKPLSLQAVSSSTSSWAPCAPPDVPLVSQPSFPTQREHFIIKQEPEENQGNLQSTGLHNVTLDDVSEIIVRDLFHSPDSSGPVAAQNHV